MRSDIRFSIFHDNTFPDLKALPSSSRAGVSFTFSVKLYDSLRLQQNKALRTKIDGKNMDRIGKHGSPVQTQYPPKDHFELPDERFSDITAMPHYPSSISTDCSPERSASRKACSRRIPLTVNVRMPEPLPVTRNDNRI